MYVVVGLGNPGQRYAATRHNVGFMVVEKLAQRWQIELASGRSVRVGLGHAARRSVALVQPQLYMNLSSEALASLPEFPHEEWIVVHDDLDLPCGRLRVRRGGGSGGHRGVDSIITWRGSDFVRVRFGVGRPTNAEEASDFVLAGFDAEEREIVEAALERAADAVETIVVEGLVAAMNRFNQQVSLVLDGN